MAKRHSIPSWQLEATYDYYSAGGALTRRVEKYRTPGGEKVPIPFLPDGAGGWVYGEGGAWHRRGSKFGHEVWLPIDGARNPDERPGDPEAWWLPKWTPVLYNLPAVRRAVEHGRTVFIVEGEKDAETLIAWGLAATCNPGGAGRWAESYTQSLRGTDVVVLPDNDEAGRLHARKVADSLVGKATLVRLVHLPGLGAGEDVTDWTEGEGTPEQLRVLVDQTPPYKPTPVLSVEENLAHGHVGDGAPASQGQNISCAERALSLSESERLPERVFPLLPQLLQEAMDAFRERHERDVFLTGALPVLASCMPQVRGAYGHNAEELAPPFYACVIAGAAGGKSPLRWSERLAARVDEHLRTESAREQAVWKDQQEYEGKAGNSLLGDQPPHRSLVLPANTSAAAFHKALADRRGRALVIETEIDTLTSALGQEWGRFDDTLRKAFHHERVSYLRKTEEVSIADPVLALVLSGTPQQFRQLVQSPENGLYSRLAVYYFEAPPVWLDQRPTHAAREKKEQFERLAERVKEMYRVLARRSEPLAFALEARHWDQHRDAFAQLLELSYEIGAGRLESVVKRAGVVAFRIAMTLRVARAMEQRVSLLQAETLTAGDEDIDAGIMLAKTYADHALRFGQTLEGPESKAPGLTRAKKLLPHLPGRFSNQDFYDVAADQGIEVTNRQLRRDLQRAAKSGLIKALKKSRWSKHS